MWSLEPTDDYQRALKWYAKKRRPEMVAVLSNLDDFWEALKAGAKPQQIRAGCIHPEPGGVLAFDQKGGGGQLRETRLYVYPDESCKTLHLITIGDKSTQAADIKLAKDFVASQNKKES